MGYMHPTCSHPLRLFYCSQTFVNLSHNNLLFSWFCELVGHFLCWSHLGTLVAAGGTAGLEKSMMLYAYNWHVVLTVGWGTWFSSTWSLVLPGAHVPTTPWAEQQGITWCWLLREQKSGNLQGLWRPRTKSRTPSLWMHPLVKARHRPTQVREEK